MSKELQNKIYCCEVNIKYFKEKAEEYKELIKKKKLKS